MKRTSYNASRRSALKTAAAGVAALAMPMIWTPSRAASKRIVVRDDGGIYSKAYGAVFYKPFTEATGIQVVGVQANAEPTAQIRSMVDTGNYTWDMAKISQPAILMLTEGGKVYLEKHGLESDPVVATIPKQYMSPYGVGNNVYTTVLAYRTDAFKGRRAPASWADFWDVKNIPGRRDLAHLQRKRNVLQDGHVREQRVVLEHHADIPLVRRAVGDVVAVDQHAAFVGPGQAGDQAEQRGLARPGWAQQGQEFAAGDVQVGRRQGDEVAIAFAQAGDLQIGRRHGVRRLRRFTSGPSR